jgi:hypothetical protein
VTFDERPSPHTRRLARTARAVLKAGAQTSALGVRLRDLAPYAVIELVLPGGSLLALLLWLYRRQRKASVFPTDEILALL